MYKSLFIQTSEQGFGSEQVNGEVWYWNRYKTQANENSIPEYLEDNADRLRLKYLSFIYDLSERSFNGKSIKEHLDLGDGFSFWWMTFLAEKSPFKSPRLYDCLRVLALEEIINKKKPIAVTLESSDKQLIDSIRKLCQNLRINFFRKKSKPKKFNVSLRTLYDILPSPIQGLISLRHLLKKWPLRNLKSPNWFSGDKSIFFCSYFFNLDNQSCEEGNFYSRQWEKLPNHLYEKGIKSNWIHHLLFSSVIPNAKKGMRWVGKFNENTNTGMHVFLEKYLSWKIVIEVLKNWFKLLFISWKLNDIPSAFFPNQSQVWLWPLLKSDWRTSINGSAAMNNLLWIELFDRALSELPHQKIGVYLWENQGWEMALLRAWRRYGHGRIIGVPHATVVYWHLNNFDDLRTLSSEVKFKKLLPDQLAVNGPQAFDAFRKIGYPEKYLSQVEALRFQYLDDLPADQNEIKIESSHAVSFPKVLILGDFTLSRTLKMLRCFADAIELNQDSISMTLKPHPVCEIILEDFPNLEFDIIKEPLPEIIHRFDFAFVSNTSSAGLDALLGGLTVAIYVDGADFNHSPLRGVKGVDFVRNSSDLLNSMKTWSKSKKSVSKEDFFWFDQDLSRWDRLLIKAD
ncbi:TIGR04326 family surface carbohydrate biosynthesis protein [Leptospira kmetyi]|uniref:TIGR04326 family surface carbohydrate biosynthesis protein n=1 Tax=Leptospira kmetyi TaxID=408139 RepID=UPI0010842301|nr:TIGR04326 family surface carbohydrate biosynthesis protein [Leptospira kmetyi]TGK21409.1 hypothetical protein EHO62_03070 [Leptospira kmetyi]TGK28336.1 hypothetical protein EHO66_12550 [Leptospira kmetyi]TGL68296.1 hypothetical protein EHQ67_14015 [Leptospira kmetyi]